MGLDSRQGISPGDHFNARAQLADIIEPLRWVKAHVSGGVEDWRLEGSGLECDPGKTKGSTSSPRPRPERESHSLLTCTAFCTTEATGRSASRPIAAGLRDVDRRGRPRAPEPAAERLAIPYPAQGHQAHERKAGRCIPGCSGRRTSGSDATWMLLQTCGLSGKGNLDGEGGRSPHPHGYDQHQQGIHRLRISKRASDQVPGIAIVDDGRSTPRILANQAADAPASRDSACTSDSRYQVIDGCICRAIPTPQGLSQLDSDLQLRAELSRVSSTTTAWKSARGGWRLRATWRRVNRSSESRWPSRISAGNDGPIRSGVVTRHRVRRPGGTRIICEPHCKFSGPSSASGRAHLHRLVQDRRRLGLPPRWRGDWHGRVRWKAPT